MRRNVLFLLAVVVALAAAQQGARYLIITTDALATAVQPLAEWKQASGMMCRVVRTSETGSDTASIKNFIRNAYNSWNPRPEFVLLVGSPSNLPARYYTFQQQQYNYASDNVYGDVNGDTVMEIPVGRFPAKTAAQAELMVAKTLSYEKNPDLTDSLWMRRMTTVVRDLGDSDGWVYWGDARNAISLATAAGFTGFDSLASSRGDTVTQILSSVNRGTGMVLYRGTAAGNWYKPFNVPVQNTANGWRLPIILSITCETMTLTPSESMVGEAWLKSGTVSSPKGAVAFFGNTHSASSVAQVRSSVARGFLTGLFTENEYKLGHAMIRAKQQLRQQFPSYVADYRGFNLLGDPDLGIWTATPHLPEVTHPEAIAPEPQEVAIIVRRKLMPVPDALVCLSMGTSVYAYGYTNGSGAVTLPVSPTDTGRMRVVVTGQNLLPYDSVIRVTNDVGVAERPSQPLPGSIRLNARPSAFSGGTTFSWPRTAGNRLVIYDASGSVVRTLRGEGSAQWNGLDGKGEEAKPGVYFGALLGPDRAVFARTKVTRLK